MKKYFKIALLCATVAISLPACVGHADSDGHPSLEGSADPANSGGKLGGDNAKDPVKDSLHVKDSM
ncbi:MAG: hypothetical protein JWP12_675 [Bacteroidetes bacterium]|nr:hypothetical protein [Bacteroidota bacterium]